MSGRDDLGFTDPFPKIESHDSYIYGVLATPTDIDDGRSEFFNIQFVMHEQMSLVVLWGPDSDAHIRSKDLFNHMSSLQSVTTREGNVLNNEPGDVFVQVVQVIVQDLQSLMTRFHRSVHKETIQIESQLFDDEYQSMSRRTSDTYRRIRRLKFEILSLAITVNETLNVLKAIYDKKVLLRPPFRIEDRDTSPFSKTREFGLMTSLCAREVSRPNEMDLSKRYAFFMNVFNRSKIADKLQLKCDLPLSLASCSCQL